MKIFLIIVVVCGIIISILGLGTKYILNENDFPVKYFFSTFSEMRNLLKLSKKNNEIIYKILFWVYLTTLVLFYLSLISFLIYIFN